MPIIFPSVLPIPLSNNLTSSSSDVPSVYDVAVDGQGFMLDWKQYRSRTLPTTRDSFDQGVEAGENTFSVEGFWTRTQYRFDYGAGQPSFDQEASPRRRFSEEDFSDRRRFSTSKGVYVWDESTLSLLSEVSVGPASANTNQKMISVGNWVYMIDGSTIKYNDGVDASSWSSHTLTAAGTDLTTDGSRVWVATTTGVDMTTVGSGSISLVWSSENTDVIEYSNGRLICGSGNVLFELDNAGAKVGSANIWTNALQPTGDFVAITTTPVAAFAAYQEGDLCSLWALVPDETSAAQMNEPTFAGSLPRGEILYALESYATIVVMGTSKGVRVAEWSTNTLGLTIQAAITQPGPVKCLVGYQEFMYFGWTNFDATDTGVGRMDLSKTTSVHSVVPAFASDVMAVRQGDVLGVVVVAGVVGFSVSGAGYFYENPTNRVAEGWLLSGKIDYGTYKIKEYEQVEVGYLSSDGFISLELWDPALNVTTLGTLQPTSSFATFNVGAHLHATHAQLKIILTRSATGTTGPEIDFWTISAMPLPPRVEEIILPIILKPVVRDNNDEDIYYDTLAVRQSLDLLLKVGFFTYQEGSWSRLVRLSQIAFTEQNVSGLTQDSTYDRSWLSGIVYLRLLTKES